MVMSQLIVSIFFLVCFSYPALAFRFHPDTWQVNVKESKFDGRKELQLKLGDRKEGSAINIDISCSSNSIMIVYGLPRAFWYQFKDILVEYRFDMGEIHKDIWPVHNNIAVATAEKAKNFIEKIAISDRLNMRVLMSEPEFNVSGLHAYEKQLSSICGIAIPVRRKDKIPPMRAKQKLQ